MTTRSGLQPRHPGLDPWSIGLTALVPGSVTSRVSTAGLALLAEAEGNAPLQPLNATSHWLNGDVAAAWREADARHTAVGYATHHASCLFWAVPFAAWQATRPARTGGELLRDAVMMAAVAAAVDYGATPKRFTPGWELVLSKTAIAGAYGALALGFVFGTMTSRRLPLRHMEAPVPKRRFNSRASSG